MQERGTGILRSGMERRLLVWMLILTLTPTLLCAGWTRVLVDRVLAANHAASTADVGRAIALSLPGRVTPDLAAEPPEPLEAITFDRRLAFIQVLDGQGRTLFDHTADDHAWTAFELWRTENGAAAWREMGVAIFPAASRDLVVWQLPIWNRPRNVSATAEMPRQLEGTLILAMRDPRMARAASMMVGWQLAAAGGACVLMLPVLFLAVRRWVKPLRELVVAASMLGAGERPTEVSITTDDEVGQLAAAFNKMTRKLFAARLRLQRANQFLEQQVDRRTAELRRAKRRLEAEIRDKNEFIRAVSHDLGAPVRNIDGMANMLLRKYRDALEEDVLTKLERISANAKAQSELIADLLELSHLRQRPGRRERVDVGQVVRQLRDQLAFDLEKRGITLEIADDLPTITAERNRIRQVFQNLLDNAIKYMGDRPVKRIRVWGQRVEEGYRFTVSDTGPGIAEQDREKVFQVFTRGRTASQGVPGRGVGLAGVKTIVESYGGRVWVESEPGQGSDFHFVLGVECEREGAAEMEGVAQEQRDPALRCAQDGY